MLNSFIPDRALTDPRAGQAAEAMPFQWLPAGLAFIRRQKRPIALCGALGIAAGGAYLLLATSQYTAVATLNIDANGANPVGGAPVAIDWQSQSAYIDGQVALIMSPATLDGVVTQLDLGHDKRFARELGKTPSPAATARQQAQAELALSHMLLVWRVGATSVVDISARSPSPALSMRLANAVGQAYMAQQLLAVSNSTLQDGTWLQSRIGDLRAQALAADLAVQAYKAKNDIVDVTTGAGDGLMDEQQLGELNTELANARARVASAQARYTQDQANAAGANQFMQTSAAPNPVLAGLQQQYLAAMRAQADLTARLGPGHEAVALQRKVVAELQANISSEIAGQTASDQADVAAALADESSIQTQMTREIGAETQTNMQLSELRSLQSSADTYRVIYQNFLQRFTQAMQDQSYPIASARVAAPATLPLTHSSPSGKISLAAGLLLGLALGLAIAVIREALDVTVRNVAQLRQATGLDYLGPVPASPALDCAQMLPGDGSRRMEVPPAFLAAALNPVSRIADTVQSVRAAAARQSARGRDVRVIGCVSAAPQEGASIFAANLAFALAADGERTVLVDWNARSPWLTKMLLPELHPGLQELIAGHATLAEVVEGDPRTRLSFIGQSVGGAESVQAGPAKIHAMLQQLRNSYDVIVLDLPPMRDSNTAMQLGEWVDGLVLVTRWGATPQAMLTDMLSRSPAADALFLGVVLNGCEV